MKKIIRLRRPILMTVQRWFGTDEEYVLAIEGDVPELSDGDIRVHAKRGWVIRRKHLDDAGWSTDDDDDYDDHDQWEESLKQKWLRGTRPKTSFRQEGFPAKQA